MPQIPWRAAPVCPLCPSTAAEYQGRSQPRAPRIHEAALSMGISVGWGPGVEGGGSSRSCVGGCRHGRIETWTGRDGKMKCVVCVVGGDRWAMFISTSWEWKRGRERVFPRESKPERRRKEWAIFGDVSLTRTFSDTVLRSHPTREVRTQLPVAVTTRRLADRLRVWGGQPPR